ncbi:MAG: iron-sulfur cluster assembly accessory protein [Phycisphaerae bacterium]|nr:iron-sulfur cluster assembly accessory protein [Phycisphaerae bacterium]
MTSRPDANAATTPPTPAGLTARRRAKPAADGQGIVLTELAAQNVRSYMEKTESPATQYLYLGVKGGGCSGLSYVLDLRDERSAPVADTDEVFLSHDIVIVCDLKSFMVGELGGTTIDFEDGMMGKGFTFKNPNAKHTCGCGSSYSA